MRKGRVFWSRVDDGFYLGKCAISLVGYIDRRPDGLYTSFDHASRVLGNFSSLGGAMNAFAMDDPTSRPSPAVDNEELPSSRRRSDDLRDAHQRRGGFREGQRMYRVARS